MGWLIQAHTMGAIPCWLTSFSPTEKKKTREHILYDCEWYKKSWNPKQETLKDVLTFLEFNPGMFCFQEGIT